MSYDTLLNQINNDPSCLEDANFIENVKEAQLTETEREALYLEALRKNVCFFMSIPEDERTRAIYLEAVKISPEAMDLVPSEMRDFEMIFQCVSHQTINNFNHYFPLAEVPNEMRNVKMCSVLIEQDGVQIKELINYEESTTLTKEEYIKLVDIGLDNYPLAIEFIPKSLYTPERFEKAIQKNWRVLKFLPENIIIDKTILDEATQQCKEAIKDDISEMFYVPNSMIEDKDFDEAKKITLEKIRSGSTWLYDHLHPKFFTKETCLMMVQNGMNSHKLKYIPEELRSYELLHTAIEINPKSLRFIHFDEKNTILSQNEYQRLCNLAVEKNPLLLKYLDTEHRKSTIDALSPEKILSMNIEALEYFPKESQYQKMVDHFLKDISYVVAIDKHNVNNLEIKATFLVYSNSPNRLEKTIMVTKDGAEVLLNALSKIKRKPINLVLLNHSNSETPYLVFTQSHLATLLEKYSFIENVTLLGCNTAKSLPLAQEEKMFEQLNAPSTENCGMLLMTKHPNQNEYPELLKKIQRKDKKELNAAYILVQSISKQNDPVYKLIYIQRNSENNTIKEEKYTLTREGLQMLQSINKNSKKFGFLKNHTIVIRGNDKDLLNPKELKKIGEAINSTSIFSKSHPDYKKNKNKCPFLINGAVKDEELSKLLPSPFERVIKGIKDNPKIKQNITVKGYPKRVHVDIAEGGMTVSKTYLYTQGYDHATFFKKKEIINRKKLEEERKKNIEEPPQDATTFKSLSYTIRKN